MTRRASSTALKVCTGVAGVVAAHAADYAAVFPDAHRRARELAETGHDYWSLAVIAGAIAALLAAAGSVWRGVRHHRSEPASGRTGARYVRAAADLARFQVMLFAVIEASERLRSGVSVAGLLHEPTFMLGIVLQVVTAAGVCAVLAALERLGSGVARTRTRARAAWPHRRPTTVRRAVDAQQWTPSAVPATVRLRGPPSTRPTAVI